jgi:hypothetical protein
MSPRSFDRSLTSRTARLNVEALEPRDCPACIVYQAGGTVHVLGDDAANTVVISETATHPPFIFGGMTITADGECTTFPAGFVRRLDVQTRGGDDVVTYKSVVAPGWDGISSLSISLGTGNDIADVTVWRRTAAPPDWVGSWSLTVDGSSGDDAIITRFGRIDFRSLRVQANLGDGNDTFAALFGGPIEEANGQSTLIRLNVQGGNGDDSMNLDALTQAEMADLTAVFQGGGGSDHITMAVAFSGTTPSRARLQALAGAGDDIVSVNLASTTPPGGFKNSIVINGGSGDDDLSFDGLGELPCDAVIDGGIGFDVVSIGGHPARLRNCELVF